MGIIKKIIRLFLSERTLLRIWFFGYRLRGFFFKGKNRYCPCCEGEYRTFFAYGDVKLRDNAVCPSCRSMERQRLLWLYLKEKKWLEGAEPIKMLHFAPEPILEKKFKAFKNLNYLSVDIDPDLAMQKEDIQFLTFADNTFDFVLCSHVLAMVPDDQKAVDELFRVVKRGGKVIIQERYDVEGESIEDPKAMTNQDRIDVYGKSYLLRLYGIDFYKKMEKSGFTVTVEKYLEKFSGEEKIRIGLGNNEEIYLGEKI